MHCLYCERHIQTGRSDRKFCDEKCRYLYHNRMKILENAETTRIISILKHNRRLLKILLGEKDELYVSKDLLYKRGYNFQFHTHQIISGQGNLFELCFNYGYRVMEEGHVKVVHWKRE